MKRTIVFATLVAAFVFGGFIFSQQTDNSKQQANRDRWEECRETMDRCLRMKNQSSMMGSGMMRGMGSMMMKRGMIRRGMMGRGMMFGSMYRSDYQQSESGLKLSQPLDRKGALELVSEYIQSLNNPRLKVGNVKEKDKYFIVEIVTKKEGALVEKVKVEKDTGWLKPADEK